MNRIILTVVLLGGWCHASPALAHKLFVFASVRGESIEGEVYFHGGDAAAGAIVTLLDPDGQKLGETETDADGKFTFRPDRRCDHRVVADAGFGHQAEYVVEASELPPDLPSGRSPESPADVAAAPIAERGHGRNGSDSPPTARSNGREEQLSRQIASLRKDLDAWNNSLRFQNLLGGIGYILGIMGLASYFLAGRTARRR